MGKAEQSIIKQAVRFGNPIPERIANAPKLNLGLQFYLDAFFDLDSERTHGFSLTRIPWSAIVNYARATELDDQETDDLVYIIQAMDRAHLERLEKKNEK
jgi:hypothetical protein